MTFQKKNRQLTLKEKGGNDNLARKIMHTRSTDGAEESDSCRGLVDFGTSERYGRPLFLEKQHY